MSRTRIKICGITRPEDGRAAARLGADAIGLVFHAPSARCVEIGQAADIVAALPPFVTPVALFLDPEPAQVHEVLARVPVEMLQFHGNESAAYCASFGRPYIKAVGMGGSGQADPRTAFGHWPDARAILVDSHAPGQAGGSGKGFDWTRLPLERGFRLILAGGLDADNVASAIATARPDAVDVSSGVESAQGIKDPSRMQAFIEEVRRGDRD